VSRLEAEHARRGADSRPDSRESDSEPIDVAELADRVYRLMLAEARLDRVRGQWVTRRPGR
jgi:hypothetical protein